MIDSPMSDSVDDLILDLLIWLDSGPRPYAGVLDAWRTSCPRLPVWEEATERGFIKRFQAPGGARYVSLSGAGSRYLRSVAARS
jgi:hypothetical protein